MNVMKVWIKVSFSVKKESGGWRHVFSVNKIYFSFDYIDVVIKGVVAVENDSRCCGCVLRDKEWSGCINTYYRGKLKGRVLIHFPETLWVQLTELFHCSHCSIMTGRGRTCKAKSPDTQCAKSKSKPEEMKHESPPRCTRKDFKEEKQKGATKEQKPKVQKKTSSTDEKPSAQSIRKEKTTQHFTEEVSKQQSTPADNKKAPVQGRQAETEPVTKSKKMQPKGTTEDSPKTTKEQKCVRKEKSPEQSREEKTKVQPEDIKTAKTCTAKDKIPETKMQPVRPKENPKADRCEGKVDTILSTTLDKLRIKRDEKSYTSKVVNELVDAILSHLKQNTQCFKEAEPLRTGSYYENLKVSHFGSYLLKQTLVFIIA